MNQLWSEVLDAEVARLVATLPAIRPLRSGDAPLVAALVRDLSSTSRLRRFHAAVSEIPTALLEQMTRVDTPGEATLLATTVVRGREVAVGEARYARSDERHDAREFALVVADPWQRLGVGMELMRELMQHALRSGVVTLYGDTFADNVPMLELARRLGFEKRRHPTDAHLARMSIRLDAVKRDVQAAGASRAAYSLAA